MKDILFYLLIITTGIGSIDFNNYTTQVTDVIEFKALTGFNGRCEGECNVYFGSEVIKVNGKPVKADVNYHLFVSCPSKIRIQKGKVYTFEVENFEPDDCTTIVDVPINNHNYKLIKQLNK